MAASPFTVSGPGVDRKVTAGGPVALSLAITLAQRQGATMYVRYPDGRPYGRVEVNRGSALIITEKS